MKILIFKFGKWRKPGQRADMIFMAVSEHDAAQFVPALQNEIHAGDDHIHAVQDDIGEHESAVHQNHAPVRL